MRAQCFGVVVIAGKFAQLSKILKFKLLYDDYPFRRVLLYPSGNTPNESGASDFLSLYLAYVDPEKAPKGWQVHAQFALAMSNPNDPTNYTTSCGFSPSFRKGPSR